MSISDRPSCLAVPTLMALFAVVVCSGACGGQNPLPVTPLTPSPTSPPSPAVSISKFTIDGNISLNMIGETSQLTATATFEDGTIKDVTSDTRWSSSDMSAVTVSSKGLVTVTGFGASRITATYSNKFQGVLVRATPVGTSTVSGSVREPGQGGASFWRLSGVKVIETLSGTTTMTNGQGEFSIGGLISAHLRFEKNGYEPGETDPKLNAEITFPMQRIVRLSAGETVTPVPLAPNDMDYVMNSGEHCYPCRLIRIAVPTGGTLHLRLTWVAQSSLGLWAGGQRFIASDSSADIGADVPVVPGETIVYVARVATFYHEQVHFTLATAMQP